MKLNFRKTGNGHPIIILHGLYGSSDNWFTIARKLENNYTIYLPDARNHGRSPHNTVHTYEAMRDDLKEFIDSHKIKNPILIGHSMGGKTAMFFAAKFPEYLRALIVVDISPKAYMIKDQNVPGQYMTHRQIIQAMQNVDLSKLSKRTDAEAQLSGKIPSVMVRQFLLKNLAKTKTNSYEWLLNLNALSDQLPEIMSGLDKKAVSPGALSLPVLFIRGGKSDYIPENEVPDITGFFPAAEIVTIPDSGHWVHAEKPGEFMEKLMLFLEKI